MSYIKITNYIPIAALLISTFSLAQMYLILGEETIKAMHNNFFPWNYLIILNVIFSHRICFSPQKIIYLFFAHLFSLRNLFGGKKYVWPGPESGESRNEICKRYYEYFPVIMVRIFG